MKLKILIEYVSSDASLRPKFVDWEGAYCVVGREGVDVILEDPHCSKQHAVFFQAPDGNLMVLDVDSANGVFIDGKRVRQATLKVGMDVMIGQKSKLAIIAFLPSVPVAGKPLSLIGVDVQAKATKAGSFEYIDERGVKTSILTTDLRPTGKKAA